MPRVEPARPRFGFWLIACALCAAAGFWVGRQPFAATPLGNTPDSSAARQSASDSARTSRPVIGSASSDPAVYAGAPDSSARRRAIIELLHRLAPPGAHGNIGDITKLAAWVQLSGEDELAETLALGAEIAASAADSRNGRSSPLTEFVPLLVFSRWGSLDGPAALEAYLALPADQRPDEALPALFQSWADDGDPLDALDHALALRRTLPEDDYTLSRTELGEMLVGWDRRDPAAALAAARQLAASDNEEEQAAARQLAGKIADNTLRAQGADAALQWIDQWPDVAGRDEIRLELLEQLDPDAAAPVGDPARIIAALQSPDALADSSYLSSYAHRMAQSDLEAAQRWCATLPPAARSSSARVIAEKIADDGHWREAVSWVELQTTDRETRAAVYREAAVAAAKEGKLADAVSLAERGAARDNDTDPFAGPTRNLDLLGSWMHADPARRELLLRHALSLDSSQTPPPTIP